jgi:hypothetical protein
VGNIEIVDGTRRGAWWELVSGSSAGSAGALGGRWQLAQEWAVPAQNTRARRKYGAIILYFEPLDAVYQGVVLCIHGGEATTVENAAPAQHVLELGDRDLQSLVRMIGGERPVTLELRAAGFFARLFGRRRRTSSAADESSDLDGDDATVPFLLSSTSSSSSRADDGSEAPFQGHGGEFRGGGAHASWSDGHDTRAELPLIVDPFASDGGSASWASHSSSHHGGHDSGGYDSSASDSGGSDPGSDWGSSDGSTSY